MATNSAASNSLDKKNKKGKSAKKFYKDDGSAVDDGSKHSPNASFVSTEKRSFNRHRQNPVISANVLALESPSIWKQVVTLEACALCYPSNKDQKDQHSTCLGM
mmetsp:Transcript_3623/g.10076  ORF Transcript_3623/g.10076 Transcript_3623/m.10076 type:complete len:104 (+) Transcript_3623:164-475(+)|eukprot:CAMPEP_0170348528 /NCGR_PEP_ID=MMETSP0116_2-20130129/75539_1 /TAXON_ID=400756 /ORGANISM="Durinskia baltica, Strain CSIRO CS-38" /LENGTH=103 /DNA_ID=CAMNT_0010602381 /DNA_START=157 /DNA_END=468 /DNA_ORIENTATION=+